MKKKTFNPAEWQPIVPAKQTSLQTKYLPEREIGGVSDLEIIVRRIEATATDIAPHYADWRNVGFALSDELGESGRDYFHRLGQFLSQLFNSGNRQAIRQMPKESKRTRSEHKNYFPPRETGRY